jgi:hypothetical protein
MLFVAPAAKGSGGGGSSNNNNNLPHKVTKF